MIRNLVLTAFGVGAISLAGCSDLPNTVANLEQLISQDTEALCQFLPDVETLDEIAAAYVPTAAGLVSDANEIATEVCAALTPAPTPSLKAKKAGTVYVVINGKQIPVHGGYVSSARAPHISPAQAR